MDRCEISAAFRDEGCILDAGSRPQIMIGQLKYAVKYALGLDLAATTTPSTPTTRSVSYPKSATLVRFLLANLIHPNKRSALPTSIVCYQAPGVLQALLKNCSARILKSHEPFDVRFQKVIYLVRDRAMSPCRNITHLKKRYIAADMTWSSSSSLFSRHNFVLRLVVEHAASWIGPRYGNPRLLARYEDLLADPVGETAKIAQFLGIKADERD